MFLYGPRDSKIHYLDFEDVEATREISVQIHLYNGRFRFREQVQKAFKYGTPEPNLLWSIPSTMAKKF